MLAAVSAELIRCTAGWWFAAGVWSGGGGGTRRPPSGGTCRGVAGAVPEDLTPLEGGLQADCHQGVVMLGRGRDCAWNAPPPLLQITAGGLTRGEVWSGRWQDLAPPPRSSGAASSC